AIVRQHARQSLREPGRLRPGEHDKRFFTGGVAKVRLLGEQVRVERLDGLGGEVRRRDDEQALVEGENAKENLHLPVRVEQRGGTALAGREGRDLVAEHCMKELRTVASCHFQEPEVAAIYEAG